MSSVHKQQMGPLALPKLGLGILGVKGWHFLFLNHNSGPSKVSICSAKEIDKTRKPWLANLLCHLPAI